MAGDRRGQLFDGLVQIGALVLDRAIDRASKRMEDKKYKPLERLAEKLPSQNPEERGNQQEEPSMVGNTGRTEKTAFLPSQPASQITYCIACGPEKHYGIAEQLLAEALERFDENGNLTEDGVRRIRDTVGHLRTYTETDLANVQATGRLKEMVEDIKGATTELAHRLGEQGKGLTLGHGAKEDVEEALKEVKILRDLGYRAMELERGCLSCEEKNLRDMEEAAAQKAKEQVRQQYAKMKEER